jgi:hypothetical protein
MHESPLRGQRNQWQTLKIAQARSKKHPCHQSAGIAFGVALVPIKYPVSFIGHGFAEQPPVSAIFFMGIFTGVSITKL